MKRSILTYAPKGITLKPVQVASLEFVEANFDKFKFIAIESPTASGKSITAMTIGEWASSNGFPSALTIHRKNLQDQYATEFGGVPMLKGMSSYKCKNSKTMTCKDKKRYGGICRGDKVPDCVWFNAKEYAECHSLAIYNLHSYFYNDQHKQVLIADEAHNIIPFLTELVSATINHKDASFPDGLHLNPKAASEWLETYTSGLTLVLKQYENGATDGFVNAPNKDGVMNEADIEELELLIKKYEYIKSRINMNPDNFIVIDYEDDKGRHLKIAPKTLNDAGEALWPETVKKVIFLSATFSEDIDVKNLGIPRDQIAIFKCDSPIPPENRPIKLSYSYKMTGKTKKDCLAPMMDAIKKICAHHKNEKGIIHTTYDLAREIKYLGNDPRFMFHDERTSNIQLQAFMDASHPVVLVASGMNEGIDLKYDLARFQIITKAMFPYLGDPIWKWKRDNVPDEYIWEAIRTVIQQSGRIVRTETDRGVTYSLDGAILDLMIEKYAHLWPKWFMDASKRVKI